MTPKALEVRGLTVAFRGRTVLEDVDLTVAEGDYLGLIGPNGGGKSTLLRVVLGLLAPSRGEVRIFGLPVRQGRRQVGYVPQFAGFEPDFPISVLDAVLMGRLRRHKALRRFSVEDRERAEAALERMEVAGLGRRLIGELSGGQLQRVLIARALALGPRLLLLDEPAASLDVRGGRSFHELVAELARQITVVLVSHDIGVVSAFVRTVACLNRRLYQHPSGRLSAAMLEQVYGCPVHFLPHSHELLGGGRPAAEGH